MPASAPEDARTARLRPARDLVAEVSLARAGPADDEEQASPPGERVLQARLEQRQLLVAADDGCRRTPSRLEVPAGGGCRVGRGSVEVRVLLEDRALERVKRSPGFDPELGEQRAARGTVSVERLRLPARAVEGDHQLSVQTLPQAVPGYESFELRNQFGVPAESYGFANKRMAWETVPPLLDRASPLRTAHLRDPVGPQLHFASESFIDALAVAAGADPVEFRLRYLTAPRDIANTGLLWKAHEYYNVTDSQANANNT